MVTVPFFGVHTKPKKEMACGCPPLSSSNLKFFSPASSVGRKTGNVAKAVLPSVVALPSIMVMSAILRSPYLVEALRSFSNDFTTAVTSHSCCCDTSTSLARSSPGAGACGRSAVLCSTGSVWDFARSMTCLTGELFQALSDFSSKVTFDMSKIKVGLNLATARSKSSCALADVPFRLTTPRQYSALSCDNNTQCKDLPSF